MPFDGVAMRAVAAEIKEKLTGGRVEKVHQPERDEIYLVFRNNYENHRLLISASAALARVHLTKLSKTNPEKAPMFCMLLRKHLIGGKLLAVEQQGLERVLDLRFGVIDELGRPGELTLHAEVMGRHSNAVLTDAGGVIVDSLKRVDEEKSRVREVLPGIRYAPPPPQGRPNPLEMDGEALSALLLAAGDMPLWKSLAEGVSGLSQMTARELLQACGLNPALQASEYARGRVAEAAEALAARFAAFGEGRFEPAVLMMDGEAAEFLAFGGAAGGQWRPCASISEAAEAYYGGRDRRERMKQSGAGMTQVLNTALKRARKKLEKQQEDLAASESMDEYRKKGDLLTACLHSVRKGQTQAETTDYETPDGAAVVIELDPQLTPAENAQRYYKRYAKLKSARENLAAQTEATRQEVEYIESQLQNIENSTIPGELEEIKAELVDQGFLKAQAAKSRRKTEPGRPHHYRAGGHDIYVGRNNTQNDALTMKFARNDDVWMHAKQIPGSHVIVRAAGGKVSREALEAGAMLAAYYSRARASSSVPVDYTERRNVKKPAGARPGYVIYLTNRTLTVTPEQGFIDRMDKCEG